MLLGGHGVLLVDEDLLVNGDWLSVVAGLWDVDFSWVFFVGLWLSDEGNIIDMSVLGEL